jgi:hypothetical protein
MDLCKAIEDKGIVSVLEFIDGDKVTVKGTAASIFETLLNYEITRTGVGA